MIRARWFSLLFVPLLAACASPVAMTPARTTALGLLVVQFQGTATPGRTVQADFTGVFDSFSVALTSRDGFSPKSSTTTSSTCTVANVEAGAWDVVVSGYKSGNLLGTTALLAQTVNSGGTLALTVPLTSMLTGGTGVFSLPVVVPNAVDSVTGALWSGTTPVAGLASVKIPGTGTDTWTFSATGLNSGHYTLVLTLSRGGVIGGVFREAVNVWAGQNSNHWIDPATGNLLSARTFALADLMSTNASLSDWAVKFSGTPVSFGFSSGTPDYTIPATSGILSLSLTPSRSVVGQTLEFQAGTGTWMSWPSGTETPAQTIALGPNVYRIRVTAPDRVTQQTYSVNVAGPAGPSFSPVPGTYATDQSVTLSIPVAAQIYYTTDGSPPTSSSTLYSGPIAVAGPGTTMTIQALAVQGGVTTAAVSGTYSIFTGSVAAPTFSPPGGNWGRDQSVTLSSGTGGAAIYYTTDGSTPTPASTVYFGPIAVAGNGTAKTIKAAAFFGASGSSTVQADYSITYPAGSTTILPPPSSTVGITGNNQFSLGLSPLHVITATFSGSLQAWHWYLDGGALADANGTTGSSTASLSLDAAHANAGAALTVGKHWLTASASDSSGLAWSAQWAFDVIAAVPVTGVLLNINALQLSLPASNLGNLIPTITPTNADVQVVTWNSSDSSIAAVDANGTVTPLKAGNTVITATTVDGGLTATCTVTVHGFVIYGPPELGSSTVNGVYAEGSTIYAATIGGLSVSTNRGLNWTTYTTINGLGSDQVLAVYASGSKIYAATYAGLSVSIDSGTNWTNYTTADGLGSNIVDGVFASGSTIYAATTGGLAISTDLGTNWTNHTALHDIPANGLGADLVSAVTVSGSTIYAATDGGLSLSADGGSTWTTATMAQGLAADQTRCLFVLGTKVYVGTTNGLSISSNSGGSFTSSWTGGGVTATAVWASPSSLYVGIYDSIGSDTALWRSTDRGSSWVAYRQDTGLGPNNVNGLFGLGSSLYATSADGLAVWR